MFLLGLAVGVIITVVVFIIVKKCKKKKGIRMVSCIKEEQFRTDRAIQYK
jgi:hypothetical protein